MPEAKGLGEQTPKDDSPIVPKKPVRDDSIEEGLISRFIGNAVSHEQGRLVIDFVGLHESMDVTVDDRVILGRGEGSPGEVKIDLIPYGATEKGVSRRHARLHRTTAIIYITDLNSSNGTLLNGEQLLPHQARILRDDDEIQLGKLVLRIHLR